jgi:hypothetical protein
MEGWKKGCRRAAFFCLSALQRDTPAPPTLHFHPKRKPTPFVSDKFPQKDQN